MTKESSEKQAKFVELIFLPEYIGREKQALIDAGYSENTQLSHVYEFTKKAIIEKSDSILAKLLPKTFKNLEDVMDDAAQKGAKAKLEAVWGVLDRCGLNKKDRLDIEHKGISGVFVLPIKQTE